MKYDDVTWHLNENFPSELSPDAAATHIGMFLGWAIDSNLQSSILAESYPQELEDFLRRRITGRRVLLECCDGKLTDDALNEDGDAFATEYYESGDYYEDYETHLAANVPTIFHVADTWENYTIIFKILSAKFHEWKMSHEQNE